MVKGYYYKDHKGRSGSSMGIEGESREWMSALDYTKLKNGEEIIISNHAEWEKWSGFTVGIEVPLVLYVRPHVLVYGSLFLTNKRVIFCTPWEEHKSRSFDFELDEITDKFDDEWEFGNNVSFKFKGKGGFFSLDDAKDSILINSIRVRVPSAKEFAVYLNGPFIEERKKSLEEAANQLLDTYSTNSQTDTDDLLEAATNYKLLGMGVKFGECITKLALKCERLQDFDSAIDYYKIINSEEDIIRLRKQKSGKVRIDQTVIHGDYVDDRDTTYIDDRDTIVKDSVLNRSNVGAGGDDKFARLERLTEMKEKGLIDDAEFKQMKKEILGK